jgi:beta-lactamase regulating signal transducer with metallopeptidase domain
MSHLQLFSEWSDWVVRLTVNHLWQATIFFVIAFLAALLLRRGSARARYLVWLAASIKFAVPSAFLLLALSGVGIQVRSIFEFSRKTAPSLDYLAPVVSPVDMTTAYLVSEAAQLPQSSSELGTAETGLNPLVMILVGGWLSGTIWFAVRWLRRRRALAATISAGHILFSGRERESLTKMTTWLGITRHIDLVVTPEVKEPGVWGVWRPIVLWPQSISSQLSDDEMDTLMMHEMAHVLRRDNLVSNLNMLLCCLFWFNPVVWLIDAWLLKEREEACDETVLRWSDAGEIYASSIRKIYRFCLSSKVSGWSAAGGAKLKQRLERIASNDADHRFSLPHKLLVSTLVIGSLTLSLIAAMPPGQSVIARTYIVRHQSPNQSVEEIVPPENRDCVAVDGKKCAPTGEVFTKGAELGRVVVRSDDDAFIESSSTTAITRLDGEAATTAPNGTSLKNLPEQAPVFQSAHPVDLKRFVGRYAIDPGVRENFVLDVSLEGGELWFKPSHDRKRRLIAQSAIDYLDSESIQTRISFVLDSSGYVESLKLRGWGETIIALRLALPPASREGNTIFKLAGFEDARIVAVAGTFNGWNQSQYLFERVGNDWICRLNLPPGKYQYKFIVDGNWLVDPRNPNVVHDERDIANSQLMVR